MAVQTLIVTGSIKEGKPVYDCNPVLTISHDYEIALNSWHFEK